MIALISDSQFLIVNKPVLPLSFLWDPEEEERLSSGRTLRNSDSMIFKMKVGLRISMEKLSNSIWVTNSKHMFPLSLQIWLIHFYTLLLEHSQMVIVSVTVVPRGLPVQLMINHLLFQVLDALIKHSLLDLVLIFYWLSRGIMFFRVLCSIQSTIPRQNEVHGTHCSLEYQSFLIGLLIRMTPSRY